MNSSRFFEQRKISSYEREQWEIVNPLCQQESDGHSPPPVLDLFSKIPPNFLKTQINRL